MYTDIPDTDLCPVFGHTSVARVSGVWSESFWALKRSMSIIRASNILLISMANCEVEGSETPSLTRGAPLCSCEATHSPSTMGEGKTHWNMWCHVDFNWIFYGIVGLWQLSESASYIYIKRGQERLEVASTFRANTENQCSFLGTPWI